VSSLIRNAACSLAKRSEQSPLVYCRTSTTLSERLTTLPVPYRVYVLTCGMTFPFLSDNNNLVYLIKTRVVITTIIRNLFCQFRIIWRKVFHYLYKSYSCGYCPCTVGIVAVTNHYAVLRRDIHCTTYFQKTFLARF